MQFTYRLLIKSDKPAELDADSVKADVEVVNGVVRRVTLKDTYSRETVAIIEASPAGELVILEPYTPPPSSDDGDK